MDTHTALAISHSRPEFISNLRSDSGAQASSGARAAFSAGRAPRPLHKQCLTLAAKAWLYWLDERGIALDPNNAAHRDKLVKTAIRLGVLCRAGGLQ